METNAEIMAVAVDGDFMFTKQTGGYNLTFYVVLPPGVKCTLLKTKNNYFNLLQHNILRLNFSFKKAY